MFMQDKKRLYSFKRRNEAPITHRLHNYKSLKLRIAPAYVNVNNLRPYDDAKRSYRKGKTKLGLKRVVGNERPH